MNPMIQKMYFLNYISQGHTQIQPQFIPRLGNSLCFTERHAGADQVRWTGPQKATGIGGGSIPVNK